MMPSMSWAGTLLFMGAWLPSEVTIRFTPSRGTFNTTHGRKPLSKSAGLREGCGNAALHEAHGLATKSMPLFHLIPLHFHI